MPIAIRWLVIRLFLVPMVWSYGFQEELLMVAFTGMDNFNFLISFQGLVCIF